MGTIFTTALMAFLILPTTGLASASTGSGVSASTVPVQTYTVAMTGYNAVPEQTDADPSVTASGAYADPDIVAARSVDLADELPFGTVIEVTPAATSSPNCGASLTNALIGLRVIADSMHPRKHNQVDILFDTQDTVRAGGKQVNPAIALGVCKNVGIRVVGKIDIKHLPKTQNDLRVAVGYLPKPDEQLLAIKK